MLHILVEIAKRFIKRKIHFQIRHKSIFLFMESCQINLKNAYLKISHLYAAGTNASMIGVQPPS